MICGEIGCGRYTSGHSIRHYEESGHCYALDMRTQRVWDYAGDGFVHRIVLNQPDGKLVEVSEARSHLRDSFSSDVRKEAVTLDEERDSFVSASIDSKLDAVTREYEILLTNQLEELLFVLRKSLSFEIDITDACILGIQSAQVL